MFTIVSSYFLRRSFSTIYFNFSFAPFTFLNKWFLSCEILRNAQFPTIYDALLKPIHGQPWSTIVWFVWGSTIVSSCFMGRFFKSIPFTFSFAKAFSFYLASFFLESKPKGFQRMSFSQPKKNMNDHYPQSYVCFGGPLLCPAASWVVFFETFSLPFPFAKAFFLYVLN